MGSQDGRLPRLLNFMIMYEVDFTAQEIAFVYMVDQSQIAGTEAACWPCRDRALHLELADDEIYV